MPKIIQVKGTQCSGKSWTWQTVKDNPNVCIFDILDFYNKHKCIVDNKMIWSVWESCIDRLPEELETFIKNAGDKLIIIEHASNRHIHKVLSKYDVETLELKIPNKDTLAERALKRNLNRLEVVNFSNIYLKKYAGPDRVTISPEDARKIIEKRAEEGNLSIKYISGSALNPMGHSNEQKLICHVCNDIGGWGSGFVVAISDKWPQPEKSYREWHKSGYMFKLGACQLVKVENDIFVANMIAQTGTISTHPGSTPIRYDALRSCLNKIAYQATKHNATVHMPRIGCKLAGGKWEEVEKIVKETLIQKNVITYVYTLEGDNSWRS